MKHFLILLSLFTFNLQAQTPAEVAKKVSAGYKARSNFEFGEKPVPVIQQGILVASPEVNKGETVELETILTVSGLDRKFIALSASAGSIKLWFNDQLLFDGTTGLNSIPPSVGQGKFISEYEELLSSFPGDYPIRIEYTPQDDRHLIFLWMKGEDGRTQQNVDFRSDWDSFEVHPFRYRAGGADWKYPEPPIALQHESPQNMNDWRYSSGLALDAMLQASSYFDLPEYNQYVKDHLDFYLESFERIKGVQGSAGVLESPFFRYFRYSQADDFGPQLLPFTGFENETYKGMVTKGANRILYRSMRLPDGTFARNVTDAPIIKAEDLYMNIALLCRAYSKFGNRKYLDEAVKQVILYNSKLKERYSGLYWHGSFVGKEKEQITAKWAMSNGLVILAKIELLKVMPENHPERGSILRILQKHAENIRENQGIEGRWHQVMDNKATWLETSATAMFVYAFAEGIINNWLYNKEEFKRSANSGWLALVAQIDEEGNISGNATDTPLLSSWEEYQNQQPVVNEPAGVGAVLYAAVAMAKLRALN